jgi:hypothetical protein
VLRRLLNLMTLLSLLLFVAVAALWLRSQGPADGWERHGLPAVRINSSRGVIRVELWYGLLPTSPFRPANARTPGVSPPTSHWWNRAGFHLGKSRELTECVDLDHPEHSFTEVWCAALPHWSLVLPLALLPLYRLKGLVLPASRPRLGHCRSCGYDLRATPTRCPECGRLTLRT